MSVAIDQVKCACSDCVCVVSVDEGVKRMREYFAKLS